MFVCVCVRERERERGSEGKRDRLFRGLLNTILGARQRENKEVREERDIDCF